MNQIEALEGEIVLRVTYSEAEEKFSGKRNWLFIKRIKTMKHGGSFVLSYLLSVISFRLVVIN